MRDHPVIKIEAVTKRFTKDGPPALDEVSASVLPGRITGLVGPDGAGKTTLIRLMTALMDADNGSIKLLGKEARAHQSEVHRAIGYMPQKFGLYEDLTVMENMILYANLRNVPESERDETFDRLLKFTALTEFTKRRAGKLSGGMKQKLGLACAMITRPRILILDEPGVGVDPISRRELWSMVKGLIEDGTAIVWSTAYLDEAERCDDIILLNEGQLIFEGKPADLTDRVKGRVIRIEGVHEGRRPLLKTILDTDGVLDGIIQGSAIRVVFADGEADRGRQAIEALLDDRDIDADIAEASPRFEDAFIDALGGGPGGYSALAERMDDINGRDNGDAVVIADHLTKKFGDFVASHDMTFRIPRGQIFGLLGPNGAGKSTTFKMLCGLLKPTEGEGSVAGLSLLETSEEARARLGYMAQKFSLYGDLSVRHNLEFFSGVYGLKGRKKDEAITSMIDTFDLKDRLNANAKELPLGYKQRLALACAVMHKPEVLFLDEPTSGVDPIARREFWVHINGLVEKGVAVLVTTHFMEEAEYCDDMVLIYRGEAIARGAPDDLKDKVKGDDLPDPSMEDAFIKLVEQSDVERAS